MHGRLAVCLRDLLTEAVLNEEAHCIELVVGCGMVDGQSSRLVSQEQVAIPLNQEADTTQGYNRMLPGYRASQHITELQLCW